MNTNPLSLNSTGSSTASTEKPSNQLATTNTNEGNGGNKEPKLDISQLLATSELISMRDSEQISREKAETELYRRANQGDQLALEALQSREPEANVGTSLLARAVKDKVLAQVFGDQLGARKVADADMADLQRSLEGPRPTALERLLAERIVICKYDLEYVERERIERRLRSEKELLVFEQRVSMSQARYLQAIKALATVRKLNIPALQVNVGQNQINVSGGKPPLLG